MSRFFKLLIVPALAIAASACSTDAPNFKTAAVSSCGNGVVTAHQTAGQVIAACGQPSFRDAWGGATAPQGPDLASVEDWYYNPGAQGQVRVLRFLNGQLIQVFQDGVGFDEKTAAAGCGASTVKQGLSKFRLVQACGQPLTRQAYVVDPSYVLPGGAVFNQGNAIIEGGQNRQPVYREDLSYAIDGKVETVTLQNGLVLEVGSAAAKRG